MGNFLVRYDSRVVIYEHKMFIRVATELEPFSKLIIFTKYVKL